MFLFFCLTDNTDSTDICCFAAFFVSSVFLDVLFYWFEVCIGLVGVEDLVAVHEEKSGGLFDSEAERECRAELSYLAVWLYLFKECVWMIRIKLLIRPHNCHQILRVAEVDDVMSIARQHVDGFYLVTTHFPFKHLTFRVV